MTGQEMMTEDKVTLRLNFVCQYKIINPLRALEIKALEDQIYILLQLILREYVGTLKLDDLLRMKQEIAAFVLSRLNEKSEDYGVKFFAAGVKDIILPGDIKEILNTVLLAEKKAQANLITRREETASTRSLLNTAKLMDENQTLFRLKELEFLEKICEKIGTISLTGRDNLLEQLNSLVGELSNNEEMAHLLSICRTAIMVQHVRISLAWIFGYAVWSACRRSDAGFSFLSTHEIERPRSYSPIGSVRHRTSSASEQAQGRQRALSAGKFQTAQLAVVVLRMLKQITS